MRRILDILQQAVVNDTKLLAVLFDPDDAPEKVDKLAQYCENHAVDLVLIGGSLLTHGNTANCIAAVKRWYSGPTALFPGNEIQIVPGTDALLLLSLISGRNADYLIGKHVVAAPFIRAAGLDCIPTGYMLIENGKRYRRSYSPCRNHAGLAIDLYGRRKRCACSNNS
jgi:heptaprenylglyceryl phosphate synthase